MSTYDIQKVDSSPLLERSFSRNSLHAVITSVRRRLWGSSSKSSCTRSLAMVLTCSKNRLTVPRSLGSLFSSHFANSLHAYPTRPSYTHLWALTALLYCFPSRTPLMEPYATIWDSISSISFKPQSPSRLPRIENTFHNVWNVPFLKIMFEKHSSFQLISHALAYNAWSMTTTIEFKHSFFSYLFGLVQYFKHSFQVAGGGIYRWKVLDEILQYRHFVPRLDVKPCPAGYLLITCINLSTYMILLLACLLALLRHVHCLHDFLW